MTHGDPRPAGRHGPDARSGDGNGWVHCAEGHRHWGRFGAAGLLLTDGAHVLLQHRAAWTHEGDTWAVPGGARDSHERPLDAALREATEETSLNTDVVVPDGAWVDDHGGWSYTTILARTATTVPVVPVNAESTAMRWWALDQVSALPLHRGFARAWPALRAMITGLSRALP
jgi:8-oxo-dGTP pyrophosphatase MutT (NUDIX family)